MPSTPTQAAASPVCPECGGSPTALTSPGWTARHRRLIQAIAILLGIVGCAGLIWFTWPATPASSTYGPGVASCEFPLERFTREDIEAYARKERADGRLLDAMSIPNDVSRTISLEIAFVAPRGSLTQFQRYGWPTNWLVYRWDATYTDVYSTDSVDAPAGVRASRWLGPTHHRYSVEPDGRRRVEIIALREVVAPVVILFAAWQVGRLVGTLVVRNRERRWARRAFAFGFLACGVAGLAALSLFPQVKAANIWPTGGSPGSATFSTGLTTGNVAELRQCADGEATLASTLLEHAGPAPATNVLLIGMGVDEKMRQSVTLSEWPPGSIIVSRLEPARLEAHEPELRSTQMKDGWVMLWLVDAQTPAARQTVSISIGAIFEIAALLILIWYVAGALSGGVGALRRRRERRRLAKGLCARCGYVIASSRVACLLL